MYRLVVVVITPSNVMENDDIFIPSERNKQWNTCCGWVNDIKTFTLTFSLEQQCTVE